MNHKHSFSLRITAVTLLCITLFLFSGCSLPKIIFLHDPLSAEEHNKLGAIYESQGKTELARKEYHAALKRDSQYLPALLLLGDLSFRMKNYSEAESAYKKALKLQPRNGDIYNNLCWVYLEQHAGLDQAEDLINTAIATTPEHRAYYLDTKGVVLLRLGKTAESIPVLKEAIDLLPKDNAALMAEAYAHLAEAYRLAGDATNALKAEQSASKYSIQR